MSSPDAAEAAPAVARPFEGAFPHT